MGRYSRGPLITDGMKKTPGYVSWKNMKSRCYNINHVAWERYGGRGIVVCDRWKESFINFLSDMGPKPFENAQIDRIDNNGNYDPSNCRWSTPSENSRNRRDSVVLTHDGITLSLHDWAVKTGINYHVLSQRLFTGWSVERALTQQPRRSREVYHG